MTERLEEEHLDNYDVPERPLYFSNPMKFGEVIPVRRDNLTYKFDLTPHI